MRDMDNAILISTAYNPLFAGTMYPDFRRLDFQNIHARDLHGRCRQPVVTLERLQRGAAGRAHHARQRQSSTTSPDAVGVAAEFADDQLGPGDVNFMPRARASTSNDSRAGGRRAEGVPVPGPARAATAARMAVY